MRKVIFGFYALSLMSLAGYAQDIGLPIIKNFSPEEYNAEPQNWQISQSADGLILFANNSGLLQFDGVNWSVTELPKNVARSVGVGHDGKIYVGAVSDLGYINEDVNGNQEFVSFLDKIPTQYHDFIDVWRTSATADGIYFKTNKYVFLWDGNKITTWSAPKFFAFSFVVNNDFYVKEDSLGLICFRNKQLIKIPSGEFFKKKEIRSIVSYRSDALLISTLDGMYIYSVDGTIIPFKTEADDFIKTNLLFSNCRINDDCIALGSFRGGMVLINNRGKVIGIVNEEMGLRENSIRTMFLDREGSLWLGLNNGISRVEINSPITVFDKRTHINASVNQIHRHAGTLYIGTSVGLNYLNPKTNEVKTVEKFADQVWSILSVGNEQLIGTNNNTFVCEDFKLKLVNNSGGSSVFLSSAKDKNRVYVGLRDGLQSLYQSKKGWVVENQFKEIKGQVRSLAEDAQGAVWLHSNIDGILRLTLANHVNNKIQIDKISLEGLPVANRYKLISLNNEIFVFAQFKFYKYNLSEQKFTESDIQIKGALPKGKDYFELVKTSDGSFLAWSSTTIGYLRKQDEKNYVWDENPFHRIRDKAINSVYPDGDSLVWVGSSNGLYRLNLMKKNVPLQNYQTLIRKVTVIDSDSVIYSGLSKNNSTQLNYSLNKLRFQFASPVFDQADETEYQTMLEGSDKGWSAWSTSTKKDYTNLWEGNYTFRVKSRNIYNVIGAEAQYSFVILPPWYRTKSAYFLYALGVVGLFYAGVRIYSTNLKRSNKALETLVETRTQKIQLQKEEIESQRDNILQKNTLLEEQKNKIEETQQVIEKQNDALTRMNRELEKIVEQRTHELTKTNAELLAVNKELDTFVYRAAHDLRGPVATLLGLCQLSRIETKDHAAIEYLSKIQLTAERMNFLLFMLLKINRIKTTAVSPTTIDIENLVRNIIDSGLANYQNKSDFKVVFEIDKTIQLHSDVTLLTIILENLIDNAIKFARPEVESIIKIEIKKEADRVKILVSDNGMGIAEEYGSKIFDMFFIGTAERKGLGLGLHAVQMAAKKLKGTVQLLRTDSSMTQFLVDIPEKENA